MHAQTNVHHIDAAHAWRQKIATLEQEVADATAVVALSEAGQAKAARDEILGRGDRDGLEAARQKLNASRNRLDDAKALLQAARDELSGYEHREGSAKAEVAMNRARAIMRDRCEAAREFDQAAAALEAAYNEFERLGRELLALGDVNLVPVGAPALGFVENLRGHARLDAALPACISRIIHMGIPRTSHRGSLEPSERQTWRQHISE